MPKDADHFCSTNDERVLHSKRSLVLSIEALRDLRPDVIIIGSGPAGVAVAEYLYTESKLKIAILERGEILTTTHVNNFLTDDPQFPQQDLRRAFIETYGQWLWQGSFKKLENDLTHGGMLILALGGRGIVAGAHLRRFYNDDFTIWPGGHWPIDAMDLDPFYTRAELVRHVSYGASEGTAQVWAMGKLSSLNASIPPWGVDIKSNRNNNISRGYDSSVTRLWALLHRDYMAAQGILNQRRLLVATHAYATRLIHQDGKHIKAIECWDSRNPSAGSLELEANTIVLAASPIESTRIFLNSDLGDGRPAVGKYLTEHIYCRGWVTVASPDRDARERSVNIVIPPKGRDRELRYHINVQDWPDAENKADGIRLRLTATVAMDPNPDNQVALARDGNGAYVRDEDFDVPMVTTLLNKTDSNRNRVGAAIETMREIAQTLGGNLQDPTELPPGRSHHEAGTLRMGPDDSTSVVDRNCKVYGIDNLYVADAAVFPCAGVANPMLTVTTLAYRLAHHIAAVRS